MPDAHKLEDQAALYLLGRLTPAEHCEFEVSLAESAELRTLVRDLEEGAAVLAMAVPQRQAPQLLWERIEQTVAEETKRNTATSSLWAGWWHNGWASAAACLLGWLLYALWMHRANLPGASPATAASEVHAPRGVTPADSLHTETGAVMPQPPTLTDAARRPPQVDSPSQAREIDALRWQTAELERQVAELSRSPAQEQALLANSSRFKFFQLVPTSSGGAGATPAMPSTELQRALFLALARELGWLQSAETGQSNSGRTNELGVDFVNLYAGANESANPTNVQLQAEHGPAETSESLSLTTASTRGIPVFAFGNTAYLAFDSTVVTNGSLLTFFAGTASQGYQSLGTAVLRNNPLVVAIPLANTTLGGLSFTVTAATASGPLNTFGPPSAPVSTPP